MSSEHDAQNGSAVRCSALVRPVCDIQSENGVALLLGMASPQNHQSATARRMRVEEIVRYVVSCPKCLDLFLATHTARLKECLKTAHNHWKSAGEPDLGECLVEHDIDSSDYLFFAYLKLSEGLWPNTKP